MAETNTTKSSTPTPTPSILSPPLEEGDDNITAPTTNVDTESQSTAPAAMPVQPVPANTPASVAEESNDAVGALDLNALFQALATANMAPATGASGGGAAEPTSSGPTPRGGDSGATDYFEHTNWAREVEEDAVHTLQRLANVADDEHKADGSKTVQEYYSRRLARLIKEGPVPFDQSHLQ